MKKTITNIVKAVGNKRFALKKHSLINTAFLFCGAVVLVLFMGAFCNRNIITVNDNGSVGVYCSASADTDTILAELGYTLSAADYRTVTYTGDNEIYIDIERGINVSIKIDGVSAAEITVKKGEKTLKALEQAGIYPAPADELTPSADTPLMANAEISLLTAHCVTVRADGAEQRLYTVSGTVGDVLEAAAYEIGENDLVSPSADTEITEDTTVTIDRVTFVKRVTVEPVPYKTVEVPTANLAIGERQVQTRGANSAKRIYATEKYINGELASEEITATEYINGHDEIVLVGAALSTPYSTRESETASLTLENGLPTEFDYVVSGNATAYTAKAGCGTYSGRPLVIGSVGVDPSLIPFGSELYIVSKDGKRVYGYAVASDTGDMTDIIADCYMGVTSEHYSDACAWGLQTVDIYILKTGDNSVSWM